MTQAAASRPGRLRIGVVGAGRVGGAVAAAWRTAGHRVVAATPATTATALLDGVPRRPADEVVGAADLALLTVPDDVLPGLVSGLAAAGAWRPGQLVVHCSGAHGLRVLGPARDGGALPLALHPVMSFSGSDVDVQRLLGASVGVTADPALLAVGLALAVEMGGEPVPVADADRVLYHAALAHAANHLVTLVAQSSRLLTAAGVAEPGRMLGPLLGAALDGALRRGDAATTGPVVRGDAGTVAAHLAALSAVAPDVVASYRALARATADQAIAGGRLSPDAAAALLGALADRAPGGAR